MRTIIIGLAATALLAGCSDEPKAKPKVAKAASLQPGEYEVSASVTALRSTDNSTPATPAKLGEPAKVTRICVPADGALDGAAFAETNESCTAQDDYMRGGRIALNFRCNRAGMLLTHYADGDFTADSFEAKVLTTTYFSGPGDYELSRKMTGKRVGDCPAAPPAAQ